MSLSRKIARHEEVMQMEHIWNLYKISHIANVSVWDLFVIKYVHESVRAYKRARAMGECVHMHVCMICIRIELLMLLKASPINRKKVNDFDFIIYL